MKKKHIFYCYCKDTRGLIRLPLPETDAEFAIVTERYFGVPLHIKCLDNGYYEIAEDYNLFGSYSDYYTPKDLWNWIFGRLNYGGVSRSSYGQFEPRGHRHAKRLRRWVLNRQKGGSCANYVRKPFQRLAAQIGVQREQRDSR